MSMGRLALGTAVPPAGGHLRFSASASGLHDRLFDRLNFDSLVTPLP